MDASQWSQQATTLARPMEEIENTTPPNNNNNPNIINSTNSRGSATTQQDNQQASLERRTTRPQKDQNINCPRCNSTNTKFCYYNNYSLTQPRFFCKTCRRYWTQGGSLRNVPVGGGSRKNKRSSSSSSSYSTPSITPLQPPHNNNNKPPQNPNNNNNNNNNNIKFLEGQDLNLSFPIQSLFHHNIDHQQLPKLEGNNTKNENYGLLININGNISTNNSTSTTTTTTTTPTSTTTTTTNNSTPLSSLELLRSGITSRGSLINPFVPMSMPDSNTLYHQSGYPNFQEFKQSMNLFSSPNHENNENNSSNGARLLFPFADMNKLATNTHQHHDQSKGGSGNDHHNGYWSGMLGGGTW